jgi:hypothetical protein
MKSYKRRRYGRNSLVEYETDHKRGEFRFNNKQD